MKKDVLITIKGEQTMGSESDTSEMVVTGRYFRLWGNYFLHYREEPEYGFGGQRVVLKFERESSVVMQRQGKHKSRLTIERGRRHQCQYDTGFGGILIGVSGQRIASRLTDAGGDVEFSYTLDINNQMTYNNIVSISVRGC